MTRQIIWKKSSVQSALCLWKSLLFLEGASIRGFASDRSAPSTLVFVGLDSNIWERESITFLHSSLPLLLSRNAIKYYEGVCQSFPFTYSITAYNPPDGRHQSAFYIRRGNSPSLPIDHFSRFGGSFKLDRDSSTLISTPRHSNNRSMCICLSLVVVPNQNPTLTDNYANLISNAATHSPK